MPSSNGLLESCRTTSLTSVKSSPLKVEGKTFELVFKLWLLHWSCSFRIEMVATSILQWFLGLCKIACFRCGHVIHCKGMPTVRTFAHPHLLASLIHGDNHEIHLKGSHHCILELSVGGPQLYTLLKAVRCSKEKTLRDSLEFYDKSTNR